METKTNVDKSGAQSNPFEGTTKKVVIAENSAKAQNILKRTKKATGKKEDVKKDASKPTVKKAPKERAESNEHIGERLLAEKASTEKIIAAFTKVYKEKKGITDKKFIKARAEIYMNIAKKRAEAKKAVKTTVKKDAKAA